MTPRPSPRPATVLCAFAALLIAALVSGISHAGHGATATAARPSDAQLFADVILIASAVVLAGLLGRWLAALTRQPPVLGELLIGVAIGNIFYWLDQPIFVVTMHLHEVEQVFFRIWTEGQTVTGVLDNLFRHSDGANLVVGERLAMLLNGPEAVDLVIMGMTLWLFSHLGVLFLLFMVGLESSLDDLKKTGEKPFLVAASGILLPFLLGFLVSAWLLPEMAPTVHLFVGATLTATSVGITARVFKDLDQVGTKESSIILGAAVIDDVLGLIILAIVLGVITTGMVDLPGVLRTVVLAMLFFGIIVLAGERLVSWGARIFWTLDRHTYKLLYPLVLGFMVAWVGNLIGLAPIIGAFAAGLMLSEHHFARYSDRNPTVREMFRSLEIVFAPVFFVLMGMQVNLASFIEPAVPLLALALTVAAVLGKLASGLAAGRNSRRWVVGLGMVPRGEVGLIFASVGKAAGVVPEFLFSAIVMMVVVTTFVTPIALRRALVQR